jgi:hypothetical protein
MPSERFRVLVLVLAAWCAGCGILPEEPTKLADRAHCEKADQCKSGYCSSDGLCAPSSCDCSGDTCPANGQHSSDCASNELCVLSTSIVEDIGQFFSGDKDNDGYCELPCTQTCPEHFSCGGEFCTPILGWADPVPSVTWSGGAEGMLTGKGAEQMVPLEHGKPVILTASAESPQGTKLKPFAWTVVNDSGERAESTGESVDLTIDPGGSFRRAELTVSDEKSRSSILYVIFNACSGTGEECGYQGSGCCTSCDDATNLCL